MNSMTPSVTLPRPSALDAFLRRRLLAQLAPCVMATCACAMPLARSGWATPMPGCR